MRSPAFVIYGGNYFTNASSPAIAPSCVIQKTNDHRMISARIPESSS